MLKDMKYRYMGGSGLLVSRLTLGTMTFGAPDWGCDEKESHAIMKAYLDGGGNMLDTADVYAGGTSEQIIGSFLPQISRDDVLIASKSYFPRSMDPNNFGSSKKHLIKSCEASLKRMGTDYIDLYYIHGPDPVTPFEETMRALDDLVSAGKIRYVGCSNLFGWHIAKLNGIAENRGYEKLTAGQYLYNLVHREPEREIIPAAVDSGVGIFCYSPLGGGLLTGKYKNQEKPEEGSRLSYRSKVDGPRFWHPKGLETAAVVEAVAAETGLPMPKLAIGWPLGRPFVTSVILGIRTTAQLTENMEHGDWDLPEDVWNKLEEKSRPTEDYLSWFNKTNYERHFSAAEHSNRFHELP